MSLSPGTRLGPYAVTAKIGEGGMGEVYRATDTRLDRTVAIKVLPADLASDPERKRRLDREAKTISSLNHPHICTLHDIGTQEPSTGSGQAVDYLVMEYLEGETLADRLARHGPLPTEDAVRYASQIASALEKAHDRQIVHRDLKPGNVMLTESGVKVLDFGIATRVADRDLETATRATGSLADAGGIAGTLPYMAPEVLRGEPAAARSDVWALGVLLYETLGGQQPFAGATGAEVTSAIMRDAPPPLPDAVPDGLQTIVQQCLRKDPAQRYQRAGEVRAALQAVSTVEPAGAGPRLSRRGVMALTGAAVAVALFAGWRYLPGTRDAAVPASAVAPVGEATIDLAALALDDRPTIAVLPFDNLSAREENSYLPGAIHSEVLRLMPLVRDLAVISRTSVLQYADAPKRVPEIAAELGARYIVEGSVQEDQGRVRINVQLIDAETDRHMWAESFDRTREDIFDLQSEVALAIAAQVEVAIGPDERARIEARPTEDLVAYDLYLSAVELRRDVRAEYDARVALLRRATARDPDFALAHARLANDYQNGAILYGDVPDDDSALARADLAFELAPDLPLALVQKSMLSGGAERERRALLEEAVALDPSEPAAWQALAALGWQNRDNVGGAVAGRRGVWVAPNDHQPPLHLAYCLGFVGMYDEAMMWFERTLELDPRETYTLMSVVLLATANGDYPAARRWAARAREAGADVPLVLYAIALLEIAEGNMESATDTLSEVVQLQPNEGVNGTPRAQALLGWVLAESGDPEGRARLESLRELRLEQVATGRTSEGNYRDLAVIASVLGSPDEQLRWFLEAAPLDRARDLYLLRDLPWLDPIRSSPEFQSWLEDEAADVATQQLELEALGPWTVDAVLGRADWQVPQRPLPAVTLALVIAAIVGFAVWSLRTRRGSSTAT
jgi:non-specific serine/threonine protein kinase